MKLLILVLTAISASISWADPRAELGEKSVLSIWDQFYGIAESVDASIQASKPSPRNALSCGGAVTLTAGLRVFISEFKSDDARWTVFEPVGFDPASESGYGQFLDARESQIFKNIFPHGTPAKPVYSRSKDVKYLEFNEPNPDAADRAVHFLKLEPGHASEIVLQYDHRQLIGFEVRRLLIGGEEDSSHAVKSEMIGGKIQRYFLLYRCVSLGS